MRKTKEMIRKILPYLCSWQGIVLVLYLSSVMAISVFLEWEGELSRTFALRLFRVLAAAICICPVVLWVLERLKIHTPDRTIPKWERLLWCAVFFLASCGVFLRWYLAYYPGAFSSDALYQYRQTLSGEYHNWKPIIQTLITFTLPFQLTGRADAVVLFQILEYAGILTYTAYVLLQYGGRIYAILSLLYVLANPVTGNIVVCPWKDVTFAMLAVLLLTFGLQIHRTDGKWLGSRRAWWSFAVVLVLTTFVRHNGFFFTVPFVAAVFVRLGKKKRLEILLFFFAAFGLLRGCLYPILSVEEEWNYQTRVLGLPLAVLGNVAQEAPEALDDSTREFLYAIAPEEKWKNVYVCGSFNAIKWQTDQPYIERTGAVKVLSMAARSALRAPRPALRALFALTDMAYAIDGDVDWKIPLSMGENDLGLEFHEIWEKGALEEYTEDSKRDVRKYLFWEVGVVNLVILAAALGKCRYPETVNRKRVLFGLPVLCYNFGTMLLLSGNDFRYFYYCFPVLPVVLLILFGEETEQRDENWRVRTAEKMKAAITVIASILASLFSRLLSILASLFSRLLSILASLFSWLRTLAVSAFSAVSVPAVKFISYIGPHIRKILRKSTRKMIDILKAWLGMWTMLQPGARAACGIYTFLLSGMFVVGGKMNMEGNPYFKPLVPADFLTLVLLFFFFLAVGVVLLNIVNGKRLIEIRTAQISKKWWLCACLAIMVLWIPYLLAYYPGTLSPDSFTSLLQARNLELLYNHVPIAYTLLIALFARIGWMTGDANFGVFLFTLVQTLIMAGVLSYSAYWVRRKVRNRIVAFAILLFYSLNPIVALYSITMWKDVLYSAWIVLFCLFLFDMAMDGGEKLGRIKGLAQLSVLFLLVSFGRNNGIYAVIFCWIALLILYREVRRKLAAVGGSVILSILLIQGPGYDLMGIRQGGFVEAVGIPLQQICYTVVTDGPLGEKEQEFLENIIPIETIKESYSPISADNIKFHAEFDTVFFEMNKSDFISLYFKLLPSHVRAYVQAYLLSTSGFWHIEPVSWITAERVYENDMGIHNVDYFRKFFHYDLKEWVSGRITSLKNGPVTNVGLMVWLVFFYVIACLSQKQSWKAALALPLIGCWLTLMIATPVNSQFRYVYYYHLMLPVAGVMFFMKRRDKQHGKIGMMKYF